MILYRVSTFPRYEGWTAPEAPGEFRFSIRDVLGVYREAVRIGLAHIHMHSRRNGIYLEHVAAVRVLAWLEELWLKQYPNESDDLIPWPDGLQSPWSTCSGLVLTKRFVAVTCPACRETYRPDEVQVLAWSQGGGRAASGGKGLLCPQGHGLYVIVEWDT